MNWSIWAAGAFDYGADKVGLGYGAVADFNQKNWALRTGYFLVPSQSNANTFDMHLVRRGNYIVELETRYTLFSRPGKLRTIGWVNSAFSGSYRETLDNPALNLDISQTRTRPDQIRLRLQCRTVGHRRHRPVRPLELERRQERDHGVHRYRCEPLASAHRSRARRGEGRMTSWASARRSTACRMTIATFIAAGGVGILIGDGRLNYRQERVLESFLHAGRHQGGVADLRLSAPHQPGLQRRSRADFDLLRPRARRVLKTRPKTTRPAIARRPLSFLIA